MRGCGAGSPGSSPLSSIVRCHLAARALGISIVLLTAAALLTLYTMLHASGWQISLRLVGFMLWALIPYCAMGVLSRTIGTRTKAAGIASVTASGAVLAFASLMYVDAIFIHISSTSALIFIFGPLYLVVGGVVLFAAIAVIGNNILRRNDT